MDIWKRKIVFCLVSSQVNVRTSFSQRYNNGYGILCTLNPWLYKDIPGTRDKMWLTVKKEVRGNTIFSTASIIKIAVLLTYWWLLKVACSINLKHKESANNLFSIFLGKRLTFTLIFENFLRHSITYLDLLEKKFG